MLGFGLTLCLPLPFWSSKVAKTVSGHPARIASGTFRGRPGEEVGRRLGVWMGGTGMRSSLCPLRGSLDWLFCLILVEATAVWPQGLLDAYLAMIPKVDGDSTPLGQRLFCVLPLFFEKKE